MCYYDDFSTLELSLDGHQLPKNKTKLTHPVSRLIAIYPNFCTILLKIIFPPLGV